MVWYRLCAAALAGALLAPLPARAATYTMDEAVRQALESNPGVESSRQSVDAAESGRKAARSSFGPSVSSTYSYTRYNEDRPSRHEHNAYAWSVGASQPLFTGFNLLNTYQKAALQKDNQVLQLDNTRLNIVAQVQAQFLAYLKAQANARWSAPALSWPWPGPPTTWGRVPGWMCSRPNWT